MHQRVSSFSITNSGSVVVVFGTDTGKLGDNTYEVHQNQSTLSSTEAEDDRMEDEPEPCDRFGIFTGGYGNANCIWPPPDGFTFTQVQWDITLNTHGQGIHTIFTIAKVTPLLATEVDDLSGTMEWNETVVDLCNIEIRNQGSGFVHVGDGFQSNTQGGCESDPDAMQDAFDQYGLPEQACLVVTAGGIDDQYCAPLEMA